MIPMEACDSFYGHFTDINVAKISCSLDHDCISVVDQGCDGDSPFRSCMKVKVGRLENSSTCINSTDKGVGRSFSFRYIFHFPLIIFGLNSGSHIHI